MEKIFVLTLTGSKEEDIDEVLEAGLEEMGQRAKIEGNCDIEWTIKYIQTNKEEG